MEIPKLDEGITATKITTVPRVEIVSASSLIGKALPIVEIRPDTPCKFHKKSDLFVFKATDGKLYGFFNSVLRRWNIQPGDTIVIRLIGNPGFQHYEPVTINGKALNAPQSKPQQQPQRQQPVPARKTKPTEEELSAICTRATKPGDIADALLQYQAYNNLSDGGLALSTEAQRLWNKYHPAKATDAKT